MSRWTRTLVRAGLVGGAPSSVALIATALMTDLDAAAQVVSAAMVGSLSGAALSGDQVGAA